MKKIAVLTSGGDAPGMNACIRSVVRTALYLEIEIDGILNGYQGMIEGDFKSMDTYSVSNILQRGGTILKSARSADFRTREGRERGYEQLKKHNIDGLVVIGGDGTFTGASIFSEEFSFPITGVPGTIDNDLYGSDYTIGFDTAINTALQSIDKIKDTAASHGRVFFVEVMGRCSGYLGLYAGIGSGAEIVLIPETVTSIDDVVNNLKKREEKKRSALVVVAEGDELGGAQEIADKVFEKMPKLDIRVSVLGHIQRGGSPTSRDRILATRTGIHAVEALVLKKKTNMMIGIVDNRVTYTDFKKAISTQKSLYTDLIKIVDIMNC